jgi:hypothetical protein
MSSVLIIKHVKTLGSVKLPKIHHSQTHPRCLYIYVIISSGSITGIIASGIITIIQSRLV